MKSFLSLIYIFTLFASTPLFSQEAKAIFSHPEFVEGFNILAKKGYKILEIHQINTIDNKSPFETYALVHKDSIRLIKALKKKYKNIIRIPVEKMIVTSTTHLPGIEMLQGSETVVGFPGTDYISSASFRSLIKKGSLKEMGHQEQLNIELVLAAAPELIIGYAVGEKPKIYETIANSGIPVILNHDWLAQHPLGKASWIYLYGALLNKLDRADQLFSNIHDQYLAAKKLATHAAETPTVFSGAMYKDVWYAPGGKSWAAQFIQDANAFREKLLLSSAEITNQIKGLSMNSEQALKIAMQAKMRSQGLGKLVAKAHLEARRKQARSEINQMEDNYIARLHGHSGTENA